MKRNQLEKLYTNLTEHELASLAFHHLANHNELELERIQAAVPRHTYRQLSAVYQNRSRAFFNVANIWALEHWQLLCARNAAVIGMFAALRSNNIERDEYHTETVLALTECLLALDQALDEFSVEFGIDAADVRKYASATRFVSSHTKAEPNPEYLAMMRDAMRGMVT